jgi:hypothetical protein
MHAPTIKSPGRTRCPYCVEEKQRSTLRPIEGVPLEIRFGGIFYDEEGVEHHHGSGVIPTKWRCSRGHEFTEFSFTTCHCGWKPEGAATLEAVSKSPLRELVEPKLGE